MVVSYHRVLVAQQTSLRNKKGISVADLTYALEEESRK
jgi:hypothetical protein